MKIAGWSFGKSEARLAALPAIAIAGCTIWLMLPQASDAESHSAAMPPQVTRITQDASRTDETAATQATLSNQAPSDADPAAAVPSEIAPPETVTPAGSPLDGLRIVDASVMPRITRGHPHAPTVMIAERAAELIRASNHEPERGPVDIA